MLKGSIVALVTPFNSDGSINYNELEKLLNMHAISSDGILILGTTAEADVLTLDEKLDVLKFSVKVVNKRCPLIVGAGSNNTLESIKMAKLFSSNGADYLLVITPYYNKTNESGLVKHFEAIAKSSSVPIIMYNVPGRTGMNISEAVIEKLYKNPKILGIKEASGNMSYAAKLVKFLSDDFLMFSGNDDLIVPMMSIGSVGVISVLANIAPKNTKRICDLCFKENYKEASLLQSKLLPVINNLFSEVNPIPVKEAMNCLGYNVGGYRMPLDYMSASNKAKLIKELDLAKEIIL